MKEIFGFKYEEEFVEGLVYLNSTHGEEFECDGDSLMVKAELSIWGNQQCSD